MPCMSSGHSVFPGLMFPVLLRCRHGGGLSTISSRLWQWPGPVQCDHQLSVCNAARLMWPPLCLHLNIASQAVLDALELKAVKGLI